MYLDYAWIKIEKSTHVLNFNAQNKRGRVCYF